MSFEIGRLARGTVSAPSVGTLASASGVIGAAILAAAGWKPAPQVAESASGGTGTLLLGSRAGGVMVGAAAWPVGAAVWTGEALVGAGGAVAMVGAAVGVAGGGQASATARRSSL
jgi:hypothetical protein